MRRRSAAAENGQIGAWQGIHALQASLLSVLAHIIPATHCSALLKLQGIPLERSEIQNDSEYTLSLYEIDFFETTSFHGRNVIHGVRLRLSARGSGLFFVKDIPTNLIAWGWFCVKKSPLWNLFFLYYK